MVYIQEGGFAREGAKRGHTDPHAVNLSMLVVGIGMPVRSMPGATYCKSHTVNLPNISMNRAWVSMPIACAGCSSTQTTRIAFASVINSAALAGAGKNHM